jgi:hypothetical protein
MAPIGGISGARSSDPLPEINPNPRPQSAEETTSSGPVALPSSGASTPNLSPAPLGDQLTKNMIQAELAAKANDPATTTTKPEASKFNLFQTFGGIKGESTIKDHKDW